VFISAKRKQKELTEEDLKAWEEMNKDREELMTQFSREQLLSRIEKAMDED